MDWSYVIKGYNDCHGLMLVILLDQVMLKVLSQKLYYFLEFVAKFESGLLFDPRVFSTKFYF